MANYSRNVNEVSLHFLFLKQRQLIPIKKVTLKSKAMLQHLNK